MHGKLPIFADVDCLLPTALLEVYRTAATESVDAAGPPIAAASPTVAVLELPVGPSFSGASDGLQSACGSHPLVDSATLGIVAGVSAGSSLFGLGSRRTVGGLSLGTSSYGKPFHSHHLPDL